MSLLGKSGLSGISRICFNKSQYAAQSIAKLSNCEIPYGYNFIKEFVVQIKTSANKIIEDAVGENISISKIKDSENQLLIAITEKRTKEEIDNLISFLMKH